MISVTNRGLDSGLPSWKMNRGPGPLPLITMYPSRAETGHNGLLVLPTYIKDPLAEGVSFGSRRGNMDYLTTYLLRMTRLLGSRLLRVAA